MSLSENSHKETLDNIETKLPRSSRYLVGANYNFTDLPVRCTLLKYADIQYEPSRTLYASY